MRIELQLILLQQVTFERVANSAFRIPDSRFGSTNIKHGIRNPETETERETEYGIRNTESNINDRKLKNFTLHNLVQSKENCFSIYSC